MSDPMEREQESRESELNKFDEMRQEEQMQREDAAERLQDEQQAVQNEP